MSDKIPPALTPEEWNEVLFVRPKAQPGGQIQFTVRGPETWQRMAAVALYGEPFGFTQEDVRMLRNLRVPLMSLEESDQGSSLARGLGSLADRIEALLPRESGAETGAAPR